jgi:hypothetical protein
VVKISADLVTGKLKVGFLGCSVIEHLQKAMRLIPSTTHVDTTYVLLCMNLYLYVNYLHVYMYVHTF